MQIGPSLPPIRLRLGDESPLLGAGGGPAPQPRDMVEIGVAVATGLVTADAGDRLWLRGLVEATAPPGERIGAWRVALRQDETAPAADRARLLLRGQDVTSRGSFTAAEFAELQVVGPGAGRRVELAVVASSGAPGPDGTIRGRADSAVMQIGLEATGTRSLAAATALVAVPLDEEAPLIRLARESQVFGPGAGGVRPALSTSGNLTADAGDRLRLAALFEATAPAGERIDAWRLALRQDPAAPAGDRARLLLRGQDVTGRAVFTAAEFAELQLVAPAGGRRVEIAAVASSGAPGPNGPPRGRTDSAIVAVTLEASGTRSLNAAAALAGPITDDEAALVRLVRESQLFGPAAGGARPGLSTAGNLAAAAGDRLRLAALFEAAAPPGQRIGTWRLALREDPATSDAERTRLMLRGQDVTGRTVFTAAEFAELQLVAPVGGRSVEIAAVASSGAPGPNGTIRGRTDSAVVAITLQAGGPRSLNAAAALAVQPQDAEAALARLAREARFFVPATGGARPALETVGNLTADAGDRLRLSDLFTATAVPSERIGAFRLALRQDPASLPEQQARLLLRGQEVAPDRAFTAAEFALLEIVAPAEGRRVDIAVVASAGAPTPDGGIRGRTDSEVVQLTLAATGTRTLSAAAALSGPVAGDEAALVRLVRESRVFGPGIGGSRPGLATVGNVTADAGDRFRLAGLFAATAPAGERIGAWRVALRQDPATPADAQARLLLRGEAVSDTRVFTAAEFAELQVVAPGAGRRVEIAAVASSGAPAPGGGIRGRTDSAVVQVSLAATGTRSLNAAAALATVPADDEAAMLRLVRESRFFAPGVGRTRPGLENLAAPAPAALPDAFLPGAFATTASAARAEEADWLRLRPDGIGGARSSAAAAALATLRLLGSGEPGGWITSAPLPAIALAAYRTTR